METQLLILTLGHVVSAVMLYGLGIFVLLKNPTSDINKAFFRLTFFTAFFDTYFAFAINLDPSTFSYWLWFLNISVVFLMAAYPDFMLRAIGRDHAFRWYIRAVYAIGIAILVVALIFPHLFLPQVEPKLYLKSYLDGGPLYAVLLFFYLTLPLVAFGELVRTYLTGTAKNKLQAEYFIVTSLVGYGIGSMSFFLVFDVPVDPMWGMFVGFYTIPIAYGIVAANLLDIRVAFKRALIYSVAIGVVTGVFILLIFLNNFLASQISWISWWTTPIVTAVVAVFIGRLYWLKSIENDRVKYEFMTVVAHKIRTPLTQINWGMRELTDQLHDTKVQSLVGHIQHATNRLIELTNIIFETAQDTKNDYGYAPEKIGLVAATQEVFHQLDALILTKKLVVNIHVDGEVYVNADGRRIRSVVEVLLENAINYTPEGGFVQVVINDKPKEVIYSVRDSGIGVSPKDKNLIFSRFYRSDAAKRIDTEGVGLGLAMAKNIVERHGGKIGVVSHGENQGATFWFSLPKR